MLPHKITIPDFVVGHSFDGVPAAIVTHAPAGGVAGPPAYQLTQVDMVWAKIGSNPEETFTISSEGESPKITIVSAVNWEFTIPKTILPLATAGCWAWIISCYGQTADEKDPVLTGSLKVHSAP